MAGCKTLILATLAISTPAFAQEAQNGDIILTSFGSSTDSIQHFRSDGTQLIGTVPGTGTSFEGSTHTNSGLLLTSRRTPNGFNLYSPISGAQVASFDTPEITFVPSDTAVFPDGTLAIGDQSGEVELYTEAGVHVLTITTPGLLRTFGLHVDFNGELWAGDPVNIGMDDGAIFHFTQAGALLGSFGTTFEVGDLVMASDGTLWATDRARNLVYHLNPQGAVLGSITTAVVQGEFEGLGIADDDTLYVTSGLSNTVYHYDSAGALLGQFSTNLSPGLALFLEVVNNANASNGNAYCFGDSTGANCPCFSFGGSGEGCANTGGSGATLSASGSASIGNDTFQLDVVGVPGAKPGLILRGDNQVANPVGDGILCTAGNSQRSQVQVTAGGTTTFTDFAGNPFGTVANIGAPTNFQFWYRDTGNTCSGFGFNFSNGWTVDYLP